MDKTFGISAIFFKEIIMNINEELYNGDLFPIGSYSNSDEEYKKAMYSLVAAETELLNAYPKIRELFDKYQ